MQPQNACAWLFFSLHTDLGLLFLLECVLDLPCSLWLMLACQGSGPDTCTISYLGANPCLTRQRIQAGITRAPARIRAQNSKSHAMGFHELRELPGLPARHGIRCNSLDASVGKPHLAICQSSFLFELDPLKASRCFAPEQLFDIERWFSNRQPRSQ